MLIKTLTPLCPLCGKPFSLVIHKGEKWFVCSTDRISILTTDIMVGKWNDNAQHEDEEDVDCPVCRAKMLVFMRSDGYVKAKCPARTCGAIVESDVPEDNFNFKVKSGIVC